MSNSLAIATVTAALRRRLTDNLFVGLPAALPPDFDINSARVTTSPPDRARGDNKKVNQINLHLFKIGTNAALRNFASPTAGPGPLALDLYYLLTAYAPNDDELPAHVMLAQALRLVHERPLIAPAELRASLPGSDTSFPYESVRLTPHDLSLEDISKLWAMYQTPARISAAVCASLVLLDPTLIKSSPLPVLRRNLDVRPGNFAYPAIDTVELPQSRSFAQLGDTVAIRGHRLGAAQVRVRLQHPRLAAPIDLSPGPGATDTVLSITLPADPKLLPAGSYSLCVRLIDPSGERTTDTVTLALAPEILGGLPATLAPASKLLITLRPELRPDQRVAVVLGDRELPLPPTPAQTNTVSLTIPALPPATYAVRLRIDGVDSDLLDRTAATPTFLANRGLTIP